MSLSPGTAGFAKTNKKQSVSSRHLHFVMENKVHTKSDLNKVFTCFSHRGTAFLIFAVSEPHPSACCHLHRLRRFTYRSFPNSTVSGVTVVIRNRPGGRIYNMNSAHTTNQNFSFLGATVYQHTILLFTYFLSL